jgi:hypothetical protein
MRLDLQIGRPNHWLQATPDCALLFILAQWTGVPEPYGLGQSADMQDNLPESGFRRSRRTVLAVMLAVVSLVVLLLIPLLLALVEHSLFSTNKVETFCRRIGLRELLTTAYTPLFRLTAPSGLVLVFLVYIYAQVAAFGRLQRAWLLVASVPATLIIVVAGRSAFALARHDPEWHLLVPAACPFALCFVVIVMLVHGIVSSTGQKHVA